MSAIPGARGVACMQGDGGRDAGLCKSQPHSNPREYYTRLAQCCVTVISITQSIAGHDYAPESSLLLLGYVPDAESRCIKSASSFNVCTLKTDSWICFMEHTCTFTWIFSTVVNGDYNRRRIWRLGKFCRSEHLKVTWVILWTVLLNL